MPLPLVLSARATRSRGHWTSCLLMFALVGSNGKFYRPSVAVGGVFTDPVEDISSKAMVPYDAVSWTVRHLHSTVGSSYFEAVRRLPQRRHRVVEVDVEALPALRVVDVDPASATIAALRPAVLPLLALRHAVLLEPEGGVAPEGGAASELAREPALVGAWSSLRAEGFDGFLEKAMGLGWVKRSIAVKASQMTTQQQSIRKEGSVTHLAITDGRGTMRFEIHTDGRRRRSQGFLKLPIEQSATWASDGALVVEERYEQHLGGERHGRPCTPGVDCPLVRTRRSVDAASGEMVIEVERTIESGETVQMRSFYRAVVEA